jgi:acetyl-CoA/propionyl-CoA carboxylase biotin carboxyl carrier protein
MDYRITIGDRDEKVRIEEQNGHYIVSIGEKTYQVDAVRLGGSSTLSLLIEGRSAEAEMVALDEGYLVHLPTRSIEVEVQNEVLAGAGTRRRKAHASGMLEVASPMPGLVIEIKAQPGERVAAGQPLVIVEAMKMRNEFAAHASAVVKEVKIKPGQTVTGGQVLMTLEAVSEG